MPGLRRLSPEKRAASKPERVRPGKKGGCQIFEKVVDELEFSEKAAATTCRSVDLITVRIAASIAGIHFRCCRGAPRVLKVR
jgi:hypothetical protein